MLTTRTKNQLKNLGLNKYEARLWTALLSRGTSTAAELSDISNVPRSRSYDILQSLEAKGFITHKHGKPITYTTSTPKEAIHNTKKNTLERAEKDINKLNQLNIKNTIGKLNNIHTKGAEATNPPDLNGCLRGRHNLHNHISYMLNKAKKHVLISTTQNEFADFANKFKPLFKKLKNRKVNIKIITQTNSQAKTNIDKLKNLADIGHTDTKARFCIVDGKEIIFMILDDNEVHPTYDVGIWVNTPLAKDLERFV